MTLASGSVASPHRSLGGCPARAPAAEDGIRTATATRPGPGWTRWSAGSVRCHRAELRQLGIRDAVSFQDDELDRVNALAGDDGWIEDLFETLPADQAAAVRARVLDERGYPEIAAELQTSALVIRKRVSRGLATLKREIEKGTTP